MHYKEKYQAKTFQTLHENNAATAVHHNQEDKLSVIYNHKPLVSKICPDSTLHIIILCKRLQSENFQSSVRPDGYKCLTKTSLAINVHQLRYNGVVIH